MPDFPIFFTSDLTVKSCGPGLKYPTWTLLKQNSTTSVYFQLLSWFYSNSTKNDSILSQLFWPLSLTFTFQINAGINLYDTIFIIPFNRHRKNKQRVNKQSGLCDPIWGLWRESFSKRQIVSGWANSRNMLHNYPKPIKSKQKVLETSRTSQYLAFSETLLIPSSTIQAPKKLQLFLVSRHLFQHLKAEALMCASTWPSRGKHLKGRAWAQWRVQEDNGREEYNIPFVFLGCWEFDSIERVFRRPCSHLQLTGASSLCHTGWKSPPPPPQREVGQKACMWGTRRSSLNKLMRLLPSDRKISHSKATFEHFRGPKM